MNSTDGVSVAASEWVKEFEQHGVESAQECSAYLLKHFGEGPELEHLRALLEDREQHDRFAVREALIPIDYVEYPLSFEDWVHNEEYSGKLGTELYDLWKREINYVVGPGSNIVEYAITGSIGGGKSYSALTALLYKGPYRCACLRWPKKHFGLAEDTPIVFGLFNAIIANVKHVNYEQLCKFISASKWFKNACPAKFLPSENRIYWPSKDMAVQVGSSELHVLGGNMLCYMIDEANFMKTPAGREKDDTQAYKLYHHATRRMKSRFQKYGVNPGLALIVSSKLATSSFLEELIRDNKDNPLFYLTDVALWETKGYSEYSPQHFRVVKGNKYRRSEILDEVETNGSTNCFKWTIRRSASKPCPPGCQIVRVPVDYYFDFVNNLEGSLRDIAGVDTHGVHPLIYRTESVWECVDKSREHPFLSECATLSLADESSSLLGVTDWRKLCRISGGAWTPLYHPEAPRFIHVDLGLTGDCAAIAMGCCYDTYTRTRHDVTTGQVLDEWHPKVWVDFMLRITPVRGEQIDLTKIVAYIINLRNYGFPLQRCTFDGFASEMAIQVVTKANLTPPRTAQVRRRSGDELVKLESYVVSVDRDDKPYRMLRDMLSANAVRYYKYSHFIDEVLALEHNVKKTTGGRIIGKVDHAPKGKKDVADAVCGLCWGIATSRVWGASTPVKESVGDLSRGNIESQLTGDVMSDYGPDASRIAALVPSPTPTPPPRTARSNKLQTRSWQDEIPNFGRHKL